MSTETVKTENGLNQLSVEMFEREYPFHVARMAPDITTTIEYKGGVYNFKKLVNGEIIKVL